jgi:ribonuclease Z
MQAIRAGLNPNRLAAIFITHLHGDHFNGLPGLLSTMGLDRRERPLSLIGPPGIREYLNALSRLKILFVNYPLSVREIGAPDQTSECAKPSLAFDTQRYSVYAGALDHRLMALGYRVQEKHRPGRFNLERARELGIPEGPLYGRLQAGHQVQLADGRVIQPSNVLGPPRPGKAIAYCTDTRPCSTVLELAKGVDLLIHEATYTEEFAGEAHEFGHSTGAQAARAARDSGARRLLITHFSTRYADITPILEEAQAVFANTVAAEDLMRLEV